MQQKTIGVFFGSRSPEHDVSIITGQFVIAELRKLGYVVVPIYIDKKGCWFSGDSLGKLMFFSESGFESRLEKLETCFVDIDASKQKFILKTRGVFTKEIVIDIAFPTFHGTNGEDGVVQGLFELCNVPYVGCNVASSALAMDKILTKQLCMSADIPTKPFAYFTQSDWKNNQEKVIADIEKLQWSVFVKAARLGSSIGITKVSSPEELENACEVALHYDTRVLVEEGVEDLMDITCAVLGNDDPIASLVQEAVFEGEHFSYESKYLEDGGAQLGNAGNSIVIPARLSEEMTEKVRAMAVKVFKLFDCSGIARVDFLYDRKTGEAYVSEINPLPGTLYHHLWKASGIDMGDLLEKLLGFAVERHEEKHKITSVFSSEILTQANSIKLKIGE